LRNGGCTMNLHNVVINVENVTKSYFTYKNEWERVASWFGFQSKKLNENNVLKNINFSIRKGESIGIVGKNGAGKSTLLKLITGTLLPSKGRIIINGRISAILELGMGFNPDLTGRQNVYHSASIMGFSKKEVDQKIDEIENFAEIGEYFDQPVRVYSSGMQVRVAFAVATAWRPEVLIIDEALSVGDTYFQHKSFSRIKEFQDNGTTLLIVSHDKGAIQTLCNRAILLNEGTLIKDGNPEEIFDFYNALLSEKNNDKILTSKLKDGSTQTSSGSGEAKIEKVELLNSKGNNVDLISVGEKITFRFLVRIYKDIDRLVFGIGIKNRLGQIMYGTNTWHTDQVITNVKKNDIYQYEITLTNTLGVGSYSLQTALHDQDTHLNANYEWKDYAYIFEVINDKLDFFVGLQWTNAKTNILKIEGI
ncbi:ABC transporter ATP-binding protein, partial [Avibacterium avium]|uniref:ABC transporter ATP-binding protein n=4 Tax=Pasteurellaceae TaxID=712 RepID=UPI003BF786F1